MNLIRSLIRGIRLAPAWVVMATTLLIELFKATWVTLRMVYAPPGTIRPGFLAVPVDEKSALGITTFANMITLTPGTTTLDVADDQQHLYVHALDIEDPEAMIAGLKDSLESKVKKVWP